ncbi:MAG: S41 family peptidase [Pedobacter sp.]
MKFISLFVVALFISYHTNAQVSKEQKVANLSTFSKVYGYVRYFHPSEEASKVNWEQFLYYGVKEVENAENSTALKEKLNSLFNPIAPSVRISGLKEATAFDLKSITPAGSAYPKQVTWQHYGHGVGPGLYKSIRTNRNVATMDMNTQGFGNVTSSMDATPFKGKWIRLSSNIKAEVSSGQAQMWLRVDKSDKMGFFDNMDARPIKSDKWKVYETIGLVDEDAKGIVFGAFLSGMGKMWVDNFKLEVEENGKWTNVPIKNASFELVDNDKPNDWRIGSGGYNYRMVNQDIPDGKTALLITDNTVYKVEKQLFDVKATFGATVTKSVGNDLTVIAPLVLMGDEQSTFPIANPLKLKILNEKIAKAQPETFSDQDRYVRLTGVMIAWNIFQHFYPYHQEVKSDWPAQLPKALSAAYEVKTSDQYLELLGIMTEKLKDGHVYISGGNYLNSYNVPLSAKYVEGKLVIAQVDSLPGAKGDLGLKPGDIITKIDGKPAMERFEAVRSTTSGSAQWKDVRALPQLFNGAKGSELSLSYLSANGEEKQLRLQRGSVRSKIDTTTIKKMDNGVYYLNIGTTEMKAIKARLPELESAKAIICDLRGYPRNNNEFINYLLTVKDDNKWMFVPQITRPDYEGVTYESMGWSMEPSKPHLNAKIIFLTAGGAVSYAESYMGFIKQYKLATIVGQPTAGANGNVTSFPLPGGYTIRFTGMNVKQQDGSQLQGIGIQPDVLVKETIKGVAEGRDEFMEKALELIK